MKQNARKERRAFGRGHVLIEEEAPPAPTPSGLSTERVLDIVSRAGIIFFRWTPAQGFSYISDSAQELLGWRLEDFRTDPDLGQKIIHPDSRAAMQALVEDFADSRPSCVATELKMQSRDGREVWLEARMVPVIGPAGEIVEVSGVAFDATALVEARDEGAEGWDHYRRLFDDAPVAMWLVNPETGVVLEANALACKMHGFGPGELEGVALESLVAPEEWQAAKERLSRWHGSDKVEIVSRTLHRRKDGTRFPVQVGGGPVRIGGRMRRLSFLDDLSGKEAAGTEARALREASDTAAEPILILDATGRVVFANGSAQELLERSPDDMLGQAPETLFIAPASQEAWREARGSALDGRRFEGTLELRAPSGALGDVEVELRPVKDEAGQVRHVLALLRRAPLGAVESQEEGPGEPELFLSLLHRHVEDLMGAARREMARALEESRPREEAAGRGLLAWQSVDQAEEFLAVFHDLSAAAASGAPWSPADSLREIGEVVEEAALRARPVFAGRNVAVHRKLMARGAIAHASLARELLVNLIVEAGFAAEQGAWRVELMTVQAELNERRAVKLIVQGPAEPAPAPRERVALCVKAAESMGATLLCGEMSEGTRTKTRFELTIPLA